MYQTRADGALVRGAFTDAVLFYEQAAGIARANGNLAIAAMTLARAAFALTGTGDASGAVPRPTEALALARQVGMRHAIANALLILGLALADTDPGQARAPV